MPAICRSERSLSAEALAIRDQSAAFGEKNDCTVRAISLAAGISYAEAHALLAAEGRKQGHGVHFKSMFIPMLARLGFHAQRVNLHEIIATYPGVHSGLKNVTTHHPARFAKVWPKGTFIMFTARHVLAIKDGVNHDWTKGRAIRCESLWRITPLVDLTKIGG